MKNLEITSSYLDNDVYSYTHRFSVQSLSLLIQVEACPSKYRFSRHLIYSSLVSYKERA